MIWKPRGKRHWKELASEVCLDPYPTQVDTMNPMPIPKTERLRPTIIPRMFGWAHTLLCKTDDHSSDAWVGALCLVDRHTHGHQSHSPSRYDSPYENHGQIRRPAEKRVCVSLLIMPCGLRW